jgi:hypothetical protein
MTIERTGEQLIASLLRDAGRRQQERTLELLHPEAEVVPLLDPDRSIARDDYREYTRHRLRDAPILEALAHEIQMVEPGRYLVTDRVRVSLPSGGFTDSPVA